MGETYSGSIEVKRFYKDNLPTRDSGDKWYFTKESPISTVCEMFMTDESGNVLQVVDAASRTMVGILNDAVKQKLSAVTSYMNSTSGDLLDTTITPVVLCAISPTNNAGLYNIMQGPFAYVITIFYSAMATTSNRVQIALGYNSNRMAFRRFYSSTWSTWEQVATVSMLSSTIEALNA